MEPSIIKSMQYTPHNQGIQQLAEKIRELHADKRINRMVDERMEEFS